MKQKIALLIDLGSLRISCEGYKKLAEEIEQQYEIAFVKFYSYVAKRNRDFNEFIAAKGYDAVTPVASRRRNKLDTRQVIDGTKISMNSSLDAVAFATGEGDILPIVTELKMMGKDVLEIGVTESAYRSAFSGYIAVNPTYLREGYASPSTKVAKVPKKVVAPAPAPAPAPKSYVADAKKILEGNKSILDKYKR